MAILKQSTAFTRMFLMVDSADHVSGKTGLSSPDSITLTISKAGGSFAAVGGTISEVANGWYKVSLTTTDTNTLGDLAFHATATGADPTDWADQVTAQILGDTLTANATQINSVAASASTLEKTTDAVPRGTVTTGASTTSVPTSALTIAGSSASGVVADQFKNRVVLFDGDTTTAGLRGASSAISANTASNTPTLTVGVLPATPASGDTFSII